MKIKDSRTVPFKVDLAVSTGIGLRGALYGPFTVTYFNTPSHLIDSYRLSGLVAEGFDEHFLLKGKSFDEMVRWRNEKLVEMLRVLEHLPQDDGAWFNHVMRSVITVL